MGTQSHRGTAGTVLPIRLPLEVPVAGTLVRRYKRFLADIEVPGRGIVTVHCPNPGSMTGTSRTGAAVRCSTSDNPKRKLRHTLEMIRVGRIWVGLHTIRANQLMKRALESGAIPGLQGYSDVRSEVSVPGGSRLDFQLSGHPSDARSAFVEVKSVTMGQRTTARFPDAVTERGRRHLNALAAEVRGGHRAVLLYCVQRGDCERVEPADDIDALYGEALRSAAKSGVEILAVRARVTTREIRLEKMLPVLL